MATTAVYLNKEIMEQARIYAASKEDAVPDIVLSLLGTGDAVEEDDLNGRKAYYGHLEKKHE